MLVTIHQPDFLPWLGFFERWQMSDMYIVLDDVQFLRRGWHHRDKIKTRRGAEWLTVPVKQKGKYHQLIKDVEIDNSVPWQRKHLNTIKSSYAPAVRFDHCFAALEAIYRANHTFLIDLNMALLQFAARELGIATPLSLASKHKLASSATQRLADLVSAVGGTGYVTGFGSRDYLDEEIFAGRNIGVHWHAGCRAEYPQQYGAFIPMLSVIDLLMVHSEPATFLQQAIAEGTQTC